MALKKCSKTLYDYQIDGVRALRQRELSDENGTLFNLPVGSGKSIIFETLSLAYPSVPVKPICIGGPPSFPLCNQVTLDDYPYFCERPYADPENDKCAMYMKKYRQCEVTVIITHSHLLEQLVRYFYTDYPMIYQWDKTHKDTIISVGNVFEQINRNSKIWILPGNKRNISDLRLLSIKTPFARVIIDDYTSMPEIAGFRQIYASSTIWISGTGWNRPKDQIPISYYTLQGFNTDKITLVDTSDRPLQGLKRSNIYSCAIRSSSHSFDTYEFVGNLESMCKQEAKMLPGKLYPPIEKQPLFQNYVKLSWLLLHKTVLGSILSNFKTDIAAGTIPAQKFPYLTRLLKDLETEAPQLLSLLETSGYRRDVNENSALLPPAQCAICGCNPDVNKGYGLVASCCGAFVCSKCIGKASSTYKDEVYCACCQRKNPRFIPNVLKYRDDFRISIRSGCVDSTESEGVESDIEYIAQALTTGLIPKYHLASKPRYLDDKGVPVPLSSKTQMGLMALHFAVQSLIESEAPTSKNSFILMYGAPVSQINRISQYYNNALASKFKRGTAPSLLFKGGMEELIGLHLNIPVIIKWVSVPYRDELEQLVGRIVRLSDFENKLYLFIDLAAEN